MIHLHTEDAKSFLTKEELQEATQKSEQSLQHLFNKSGEGSQWLGWLDILGNPDDALLNAVEDCAEQIRKDADILIVVGIGGSYLGAKAVIDALADAKSSKQVEVLYAGHQISGSYLSRLIDYISVPKANGDNKSVYLNVISKSGTTLEPAIAFRVLRDWMHQFYGIEASKKRIICTTSAKGGALNQSIDQLGYQKFIIPDNVGGRFSVLTPVGLLPVAVAGIDIKSMYYGAVTAYNTYRKNSEDIIKYASVRYALYKKGFKIDVIASFEPELLGIGGWLQQLLGESEGKSHQGLYPAVHGYSTDLHSLGQYVQDGERHLFETFLTIKKSSKNIIVSYDEDNYDGLNFIAGKSLHEINSKAFLGTKEAHIEGGVPVLEIQIEKLTPENIGALLFFFELSCGVYVYNLGLNPFDQPGVEAYKKAMYRLLGK